MSKPLAKAAKSPGDCDLQLLWGCDEIAEKIRRILETGRIPGARKIGNQWVVSEVVLHRTFVGVAAE